MQQRSTRQVDSKRSISASQGEEGGVIGGEYLVNPVFLGAAQMTSAFDKGLENDFEGAEETLQFDTDRLKPFGEEYEVLKNMEDNE